ncbi:hypothetical protein DJ71_24465 [Halorubrum sp. E3]|uniref:Uncharacterized protein n=3 Tax=Halorubrum distributum TaxID=29283 RepID=M0NXD2_9EURY|nr:MULTISPECIES: DUF5793 family protein [Halorubrum distributum group]OYR61056.1 hypothetical protein DJ71_24465 [Halorubrum sp. E3]PHQ44624.1 hypothetical protein DJ68_17465 [Halorubrum sp. C3]EMA62592.1 hypothetical protein C470_04275 [Halorubrum litoreum JCM 13561]EMA71920.1 hypothetical protein C462_04775 [Halorubrum arcis JCM 13916]MDV7348436.1 DUF5793 family protein [Halorubrum distributum]
MRRDYFDLTVEGVGDGADSRSPPLVRIDFHGPEELLRERLSGGESDGADDGDLLAADQIDVAFRLREPLGEADDPEGVVGVTNRYTGDFVLELNETATDVLPFIHAARDATDDGDARYRVEIDVDGDRLVAYDKDTFLVYDHEGNLLRSESLIPSGVEL